MGGRTGGRAVVELLTAERVRRPPGRWSRGRSRGHDLFVDGGVTGTLLGRRPGLSQIARG